MNNETVTVAGQIHGRTNLGIWIGKGGPEWSSDRNRFIPFSVIRDTDTDFEDMRIGDEIEIEIPRWLAEREGL